MDIQPEITSDKNNYKNELELLLSSDYGLATQFCHAATLSSEESMSNKGYRDSLKLKAGHTLALPLQASDGHSLSLRSDLVETVGPNIWALKLRGKGSEQQMTYPPLLDQITQEVWQRLAPHEKRPTFELSSTLLCGPGSSAGHYFSPLPKDRAFAILEIGLPSHYTGGQIEITFRDQKSHFDEQQSPEGKISALAWYIEAKFQQNTITSGYRLTQVYRVKPHSGATPIPSLNLMVDNWTKLQHSLTRWTSGSAMQMPRLLVFPLRPTTYYPEKLNSASGEGLLTRHDEHRLKTVSSSFDIKVFSAVLSCCLEGDVADPDGQTPLAMTSLLNRELKVSKLVDLEGHSYVHGASWDVHESELVLHAPLENFLPDSVEYSGFVRGKPIKSWFQRNALLLMPTQRYLDRLLQDMTARLLIPTDGLNRHDVRHTIFLVECLSWNRLAPLAGHIALLAIAIRDGDLWGKIFDAVVAGLGTNILMVRTVDFFAATKVFPEMAFVRLEQCLAHKGLEGLKLVAKMSEADAFEPKWRKEYTRHTIRSFYRSACGPILVEMLKEGDLAFVNEVIFPELESLRPPFEDCVEISMILDTNWPQILSAQKNSSGMIERDWSRSVQSDITRRVGLLSEISEKSLLLVVLCWQDTLHSKEHLNSSRGHMVKMVGLCLRKGRPDLCLEILQKLLDFMVGLNPNDEDVFKEIILATARELRSIFGEPDHPVWPRPFPMFWQSLIEWAIQATGSRAEDRRGPPPGLECGCIGCGYLADFFGSEYDELHIRGTERLLRHLQDRLSLQGISDRVVCVIGTNQGKIRLEVSKVPNVQGRRKENVRALLSLIGNHGTVKIIMGDKYENVFVDGEFEVDTRILEVVLAQ